MEIRTNYMTKNGLYNPNKKINVQGIILHSVGCAVDTAEEWWDRWNKASYKNALVHGFIDAEKTIIAVPCMEQKGKAQKAYHVANDNTHNKYLGFEMCEYGGIKYTGGSNWDHSNEAQVIAYAHKTYKNAVELFARLCAFHGLDPEKDGVILSHHEAHLRGMASGHADVEHIWNYADLSMVQFRKDVKAAMSGSSDSGNTGSSESNGHLYRVRKSWSDAASQIGAYEVFENAKKACKSGYTVYDKNGKAVYGAETNSSSNYKVQITVSDLRIRKGPGTNYAFVRFIEPGIYTIVAESSGQGATKWGKLKSGAGWIALDYANKM